MLLIITMEFCSRLTESSCHQFDVGSLIFLNGHYHTASDC